MDIDFEDIKPAEKWLEILEKVKVKNMQIERKSSLYRTWDLR